MSQRRSFGGPRREASERVVIREAGATSRTVALGVGQNSASSREDELSEDDASLEGWTLNVSRGGCRLVVESPVTVGADYEVQIGEETFRPVRVVWVRDEADGQIAGLQFLDVEADLLQSSHPPLT